MKFRRKESKKTKNREKIFNKILSSDGRIFISIFVTEKNVNKYVK